eukprot:TRINITY_DN4005_c0_g1_i4.p1 TRINITY_DN4005_c0_g1~~TRINITY_DN4005_c0_g1_i4.p1  ORF type:complete len:470 (-),score=80.65 TRINITY_DN4005_c0_g1_i4:246-1655(-)
MSLLSLDIVFTVLLLCGNAVQCVRDTKFYDILQISPDADETTIKKAYRKQAMKWHPDRNQDNTKEAEEKFREIAEAYEVLSDPEQRRKYDQFGEQGIKEGGMGGGGGGGFHHGDPFEMFNMFFGGGMGGMGGGNFRMNVNGMEFEMGGGGGGGGFGGFPGGGMGGGGRQQRGGGRSQENMYDDDVYITELTADTFPTGKDGYVWLVEFYAPWCGHCNELKPKYRSLSNAVKGVVKVGAVNCEQQKQLCQEHGVSGYPSIKAFVPGSKPKDYKGDRSAEAMKNWVLKLVPNKVFVIKKQSQMDEFLKRCSGQAKPSEKAEWDVCVLHFTEKKETPALYKSLSSQYDGKIAFGEVRQADKALSAEFNVTSYPTILSVCNGDKISVEAHTGEMKSGPIKRFLEKFANGKKCRSSIRLDSSTDFSKLKVSQLRSLLIDHGIVCSDCLEKGDYIKKLSQFIVQQDQSNKVHAEL